ncbi:hypothetical protein F8144_11820 [Streptomyces triticiradicis]|uniref:Uncharacterized protein n=1 Tax=Streptomyces triticiradicis TaxID=2651189 RepID=A0A7J5DJG4_9ACTN|nr:hypothetical protein F8144_11820 [Streptomyces triticiradicis]
MELLSGKGGLGPVVWIRLQGIDGTAQLRRAGSGACRCKAEEGVNAERRRPTTTPLGVPPARRARGSACQTPRLRTDPNGRS